MGPLNRRRFLAISASAAALAGPAQTGALRQWSGSGLGARMTITLDHPEGERLARRALTEVDRLENIFSLYRAHSALSRLNADGILENPPFELLECLSLCGSVHRATGGLFDPTVQPLWRLYAEAFSGGRSPEEREIEAALAYVGWNRVEFGSTAIRMQHGTALSLNGIAQGYVADRLAAMLKREGLTNVLIDTGEISALGEWPVSFDTDPSIGKVNLRNQALASSAPLGTVFDADRSVGHILDPRTGLTAALKWQQVSVTAPSAALADALSTAAVLVEQRGIEAMCARFAETRLVFAQPA